MRKIITHLFFLFLVPQTSLAQELREMNDIKIDDYIGFEKSWKFVTVRYRKDTGEMRFVYANDIAWKYLQAGSRDYPKGSIFAKFSAITQIDEDFPSSMAPSGTRRYQFMVRDKEKYKKTGGWGYALFDSDGNAFKGDVDLKSMACAACHQIVKNRGDVFSVPVMLPFGSAHISQGVDWKQRFNFKNVKIKKYAPDLAKHLPNKLEDVRALTGPLTKQYFFGTLDEVRPLLIEEVKRSKIPAALISEDKKQISIVYINQNKNCTSEGSLSLQSIHTVPNEKKPLLKLDICETP